MKQLLINTEQPEEKRIILLEDGLVVDYETELEGQVFQRGNIYKASIERIEPSLEAVFIDLPDDRNGFLPFRDIAQKYLKPAEAGVPVAERLSVGDKLLVQITKEKRDNKGAVLTTNINLPGCYLVLMPDQTSKNHVSRQAGREDRQELQKVLGELSANQDFGLLLRTAGLECEVEDLRWDLEGYLLKLWGLISTAYEQQADNALIYSEHNLTMKATREYFRRDVDQVICDTPSVYNELKALFELMMPDYAERIWMHDEDKPLVSLEVEQQLRAVHSRVISLPSGGQIVFDSTEALVAIDVNSSKGTKWSNIEETALQTNLEAAAEVARQLKLRDLGGLVVVDFIDMDARSSREQVQQHLRKELRKDRAKIRATDISSLGLMELSRQRIRASLESNYWIACPQCVGKGKVQTVQSAVLDVVRLIRENSMQPDTEAVVVNSSPDIATYLLNEKRIEIRRLEDLYRVSIIILSDWKMASSYRVQALSKSRKRDAAILQKLSYQMDEEHPDEQIQDYVSNTPDVAPPARPVVKKIMPEKRASLEGKAEKSDKGVFGRLLGMFFGLSGDEEGKAQEDGLKTKERAERKDSPGGQGAGGRRRSGGGRRSSGKRQERRDSSSKEDGAQSKPSSDGKKAKPATGQDRPQGERGRRRERGGGEKKAKPGTSPGQASGSEQASHPKKTGEQAGASRSSENNRGKPAQAAQDNGAPPAKPAASGARQENGQEKTPRENSASGGSTGTPPADNRAGKDIQQVETKKAQQ